MNKKMKIVSTVVLAGALSLNVLNPRTLAAEIASKGATQVLDAYKSLNDVANVVPIILDTPADADSKDVATFDEIAAKYPGASSFSGKKESVATGDTFKIGDTVYTVAVYGDINKDGLVNSTDARMIESYAIHDEELTKIQLVAADLSADGKVNSADSLKVKEYSARMNATVVSKVQDNKKEEENVTYAYTITVNENNVVNNQNLTKTSVTLSLDKELTAKKSGLKLVVSDSGIGTAKKSKTYTVADIPAHTSKIESIKLNGSEIVDLSGEDFKEGTLTFELKDEDTVVGSTTVTMSTAMPDVTKITTTTDRTSTTTAKMSLKYAGEDSITKVYYVVYQLTSGATTVDTSKLPSGITAGNYNSVDTIVEKGKSAPITNNEIKDVVVDADLTKDVAYAVYCVVENSAGSISVVKTDIVIPSDNAKAENAVKNLKAPTYTESSTAFTWNSAGDGKTYQVTLYKGTEAIKTYTITTNSWSLESDSSLELESGSYKIDVIVKGNANGSTSDSEKVTSPEVKMTALEAVTDVVISSKEEKSGETTVTKYYVTWKDEKNSADDVATYDVQLLGEDGKTATDGTVGTVVKEKKTAELTIAANKVYTATVKAIKASGKGPILNSATTSSEKYFTIDASTITYASSTANSLTYTSTVTEINGKVPTYKVEVYKYDTDADKHEYIEKTPIISKDVTAEKFKDGSTEKLRIVVDGLAANTKYAVKFIVSVDGVSGESELIKKDDSNNVIKTLKAETTINNLTVASSEDEAKKTDNTFFAVFDGTTLKSVYINKVNYSVTDTGYSTDFINLIKLVGGLGLQSKDVIVSATNESISLKLNGKAGELTLADASKDRAVEIEGNDFQKTITVGAKNNVTLKGTGALFEVASSSPTVKVADGVSVMGNFKAAVTKGTTPVLNGTKVNASADVEVVVGGTVDSSTLDVTVDGNSNTNYTFENKEGKTVAITFNSKNNNNADIQSGTITILSNGGTVSVGSSSVGVTGELDVKVQKGEAIIDVSNNSLSGTKKVTLDAEENSSAKITMSLKGDLAEIPNAIVEMTGTKLLHADYSNDEQIAKDLGYTGELDDIGKDKVAEVKAYLKLFDLDRRSATITFDTDAKKAEIEFKSKVTDVTIVDNVTAK